MSARVVVQGCQKILKKEELLKHTFQNQVKSKTVTELNAKTLENQKKSYC